MAENQDGQEKSHDPTAKRIEEARRKGQIARSKELNTMMVTLVGASSLIFLGKHLAAGIQGILTTNLVIDRADVFDTQAMLLHLIDAVSSGLWMLSPFFGLMVVVAVLASVSLGGLNISIEAMMPKWSKLNPVSGLKRIFSARGLMELAKSLAKFLLIGGVTSLLLWQWSDALIALGSMDVMRGIGEGIWLVGWASVIIASTLIVLALFDVPFQLWQHSRQLKMTDKEVRDELKETEGKPEVRGRIRQLQREMAQRRMLEEVPNADVIVTNPTHFAVAIRYDQDVMRAPIVVAKGADLIAANIRRVGEHHGVPMVEAPLLARAVYFSTELQQPIPTELYLAVAQLLAYVFQLRFYRDSGGDIPTQPTDYPIPEEFRSVAGGPERADR